VNEKIKFNPRAVKDGVVVLKGLGGENVK